MAGKEVILNRDHIKDTLSIQTIRRITNINPKEKVKALIQAVNAAEAIVQAVVVEALGLKQEVMEMQDILNTKLDLTSANIGYVYYY